MSFVKNVGKISYSSKEVFWTVQNFHDLPQGCDSIIVSPKFKFHERWWNLKIFPNGYIFDSIKSFGDYYFAIEADIYPPIEPDKFIIELGIMDEHQKSIVNSRGNFNGFGSHFIKLIRRSEFDSRKNQLMPRGNLHVLFRIENKMEDFIACNKTEDRKEEMKQKQDDASKEVATQTEEGIIHNYITGKEETKQKHDDVSKEMATQTEEGMGVWKLGQDFEKLLHNENITDVILNVQGQEFRAHRCILAARSPVFLAMMSHDTKEKNTGVVDVDDIDPNVIPDFLHYLYTGNVQNLTSDKALKLYAAADKYQVTGLKQNCLDFLLANMSVDKFCDVITLSLQHSEKQLKDACIDFFLEKSLDIVLTANWQTFLSENPIIGNELFIKHLQLFKSLLQETGKKVTMTKDDDRS